MKIDFRKKKQYFKNRNGNNDVYVWKNKDNSFSIGINGTSMHYKVDKSFVIDKVKELVMFV